VRISRASAQVALDAVRNFFAVRFGSALEQLYAGHDHARGAVAALQAVAFPEAFLHRMQLAVPSQAFDGGHFGAVRLDGENRTRFHRAAILKDSTGATNAGLAAHMCAGQFAEIAQEMNQKHPRLDFVLLLDAINFYRNDTFHKASENAVSVFVPG